MTRTALSSLTTALALVISAGAVAFGHPIGHGTALHVAQDIAAGLAVLAAAIHAPTIAKTIPKPRPRPRPAPPVLKLPAFGLDWSFARLTPRQLRALGATFVVRYLSYTPAKNLTLSESRALAAAGIKRVVVWETTARRATDGYGAGASDAQAALDQAHECGAPDTVVIFFAIDFDASGPELHSYFQGAKDRLGARVGAYGGYNALAYLFDQGLITHGYQTYAWSRGRWHPQAKLLQYSNDHTVFGQGVDFDRALSAECGWW